MPAVAILLQSAIVIVLLVSSTFEKVLTYIQFSLTISSSLTVIGQAFGGRDHTTALHSIDKIANELKEDERLRYDLQVLRERIYAE